MQETAGNRCNVGSFEASSHAWEAAALATPVEATFWRYCC